MRRLAVVLAVSLLAAIGCGGDDGEPAGTIYTAELAPVNDSGVEGAARIVDQRSELEVEIRAAGLAANRIHPQHLHGFADRRAARCPRGAGDGVLTERDGEESYGGVVLDLAPFPTVGEDGRLDYTVPIPVRDRRVAGLDSQAVVLHGLREDGGRYRLDVPVACGRLQREDG